MYYDELMEKINNYERKRSEINQRYTEQVKQTQMLTPDCVIDEEKSVKWNREEVARRNRSAKAKLAAIRREDNAAMQDVKDAIIEYLRDEYDLPKIVAEIVLKQAEEAGHSGGFSEVVCEAQDYAAFAQEIIEALD